MFRWQMMACGVLAVIALTPVLGVQPACAGAFRDALMQRRAAAMAQSSAVLPPGIRVVRDVTYGSDPKQRFDVYAPMQADHAPVIFMVHGGAWAIGDKAAKNVIENKVARWVPRGFILVSVNYRLLPDAVPLQQAQDVAQALVQAQRQAMEWGGDREKFILMGHSAGAHLVDLLAAQPSIALQRGATPWLGTVSLDSASLDVVQTMQSRHPRLYDRAFGSDPAVWQAVSPLQQLHAPGAPFLAVCSSRRADSCPQAHHFVDKATRLGTRAQVLEQDLSHEEINQQLGTASSYTAQIEAFMRNLDPAVAHLLDDQARQLSALPVVISR
jgi:arylformamidase